jgi:hypothetical protein
MTAVLQWRQASARFFGIVLSFAAQNTGVCTPLGTRRPAPFPRPLSAPLLFPFSNAFATGKLPGFSIAGIVFAEDNLDIMVQPVFYLDMDAFCASEEVPGNPKLAASI